ncbi:hypothetical protein [Rheinheimera sp.]|uniref:hypothetical protein n=1 Tax=Rheinheimera sp. TaxID=1869214 RepID=UPI00273403B2|nr:hypothetical protein [Rheinheimera sp.]MDP2714373.1 hypothetical protein [Rheinheimera sp.]
MKRIFGALLIVGLLTISTGSTASEPRCSKEAFVQAKKLLAFHFGEDDRIEISPVADELPSIRNPVNKQQKFQVLQVGGLIYRAEYRMRFIYYHLDNSCLLMGQEILSLADI